LKPERWGSPLVQEKYQEEKACDMRHPYHIIIIIIIIIIILSHSPFICLDGLRNTAEPSGYSESEEQRSANN